MLGSQMSPQGILQQANTQKNYIGKSLQQNNIPVGHFMACFEVKTL